MKIFKATLLTGLIIGLLIPTTLADTADWYIYNGETSTHTFSIRFPQDWKVKTDGDNYQGVLPEADSEPLIDIYEFEGQNYEQAKEFFITDNITFVSENDFLFSDSANQVAKHVVFHNKELSKDFGMTFFNQGSLTISLLEPNLEDISNYPILDEYLETATDVYKSFKFTDNWHRYLDLGDSYTFIFPSELKLITVSDGVSIQNPNNGNKEVFRVTKYIDISLDDAPKEAEGYGEDYEGKVSTSINLAANVVEATYYDENTKSEFSRIFIAKGDDSFSLKLDYYDEYLLEIIDSFEFFNVDIDIEPFKHFYDVADSHINQAAINSLTEQSVIKGYPNGSFKPNGEINRAELTKMIVSSITEPDPEVYKNCFPDVKDDWYAPYVCYAKEQEWVGGYADNTFKPAQEIKRVEAIKIVLEALFNEIPEEDLSIKSNIDDVDTADWYGKYFSFADNKDLLDLNHVTSRNYFPGNNITRKEVAETIYRSLNIE